MEPAMSAPYVAAHPQVERWGITHGPELKWLKAATARNFGFAASIMFQLECKGKISEPQLASVRKCMEGEKDREAAIAMRSLEAPALDMPEVEKAFLAALQNGVRSPKLRLAGFKFSPAKPNSANPSAVYVVGDGDTYLGKVLGGKFLRVASCTPEQEKAIIEAATDPKAAAIAYGLKYGKCSVCGRDLTDKDSIAMGIGPICVSRMGW
jgi:hypothetical protein